MSTGQRPLTLGTAGPVDARLVALELSAPA